VRVGRGAVVVTVGVVVAVGATLAAGLLVVVVDTAPPGVPPPQAATANIPSNANKVANFDIPSESSRSRPPPRTFRPWSPGPLARFAGRATGPSIKA
jgi:hypothetical protein